jgi:hypothetical protein
MKNMSDIHFIRKGSIGAKKKFTKHKTSINIRIIAMLRHVQRNSENALRRMSMKSEMLINKINMDVHEPTKHNAIIRVEKST